MRQQCKYQQIPIIILITINDNNRNKAKNENIKNMLTCIDVFKYLFMV